MLGDEALNALRRDAAKGVQPQRRGLKQSHTHRAFPLNGGCIGKGCSYMKDMIPRGIILLSYIQPQLGIALPKAPEPLVWSFANS